MDVSTPTAERAWRPIRNKANALSSVESATSADWPGPSTRMSPLTVAVFGPKGSGKSTLAGRLLVESGVIESASVSELQSLAATAAAVTGERPLATAGFSWLFDATERERQTGSTAEIGVRALPVPSGALFLVDSPGDERHEAEAMSALSFADVGVLVVSASDPDASAAGPRVRDAVISAKSLGMQQLVVAVSKTDLLPTRQQRQAFDRISAAVRAAAARAGFTGSKLQFVPVSARAGDNVGRPRTAGRAAADASTGLAWFSGRTLFQAIEKAAADAPRGRADGEATAVVTDVLRKGTPHVEEAKSMDARSAAPRQSGWFGRSSKSGGGGGGGGGDSESATGAVQGCWAEVRVHMRSGQLSVGDDVLLAPCAGANGSVRGCVASVVLQLGNRREQVRSLRPGGYAVVRLADLPYSAQIGRGTAVLGARRKKRAPVTRPVASLEAMVEVVGEDALLPGASVGMYAHGAEVPCTVTRIIKASGRRRGSTEGVHRGGSAQVEIRPVLPLYALPYVANRALGRFILRSERRCVAVGTVRAVQYVEEAAASV